VNSPNILHGAFKSDLHSIMIKPCGKVWQHKNQTLLMIDTKLNW
jgi:hypothetical protein